MYKLYEFFIYNKKAIKNTLATFSIFAIIGIIIALTYLGEVRARTKEIKQSNTKLLELREINAETLDQLDVLVKRSQNGSDINGTPTLEESEKTMSDYYVSESEVEDGFNEVATEVPFHILFLEGFEIQERKITIAHQSYLNLPNGQTDNEFTVSATMINDSLEIVTTQGHVPADQECIRELEFSIQRDNAEACIIEAGAAWNTFLIRITDSNIAMPSGDALVYQFELTGNQTVEELETLFDLLRTTQ